MALFGRKDDRVSDEDLELEILERVIAHYKSLKCSIPALPKIINGTLDLVDVTVNMPAQIEAIGKLVQSALDRIKSSRGIDQTVDINQTVKEVFAQFYEEGEL